MSGHLILGLGGLGTTLVGQASGVLSGRLTASRLICAAIDSDKNALGTQKLPSHTLSLQMAEKLLLNAGEWEPWVPPGVRPEIRRAGSGGIRMLARLVFLTNYPTLAEWLNPLLTDLLSHGPLHITLVCSLAGGTGGVLISELPFLLRGLVEQLQPGAPVTLEAVVAGSARPARHERGASNAYAALVELNHWQARDTHYSLNIPGGITCEASDPPYERVVLFSCRDLDDPRERELLGNQVTAYLGLQLWENYAPLAGEVARRQNAFRGQTDDRGNPVSFFTIASSSLSLPFGEIRTALASRILVQLCERWQSVITRSLEEGESPKAALEFLHREALARQVFVEELTNAAGGPTAFRHDREVASLREELERKPPKGQALTARLRTLEEAIRRALGEDRPDGLFGRVSARAAELATRGTAALTEEVHAFFRSDRGLGYSVYLEQLSEAVGERLRILYEEMSQLELDELRILQEKEQLIRQLESDGGKKSGVFGKKKGASPAPAALELVERFYQSRLVSHIHREAWNAFQELLLLVERFRSDATHLYDYLSQLASLLNEQHNQAMGQIFSVPGEVLLSRAEINDFLEDRASDKKVEKATRWVREELGVEPIELPERYKPRDAVPALVAAVAKNLGGLEGVDAVDQFFQRYRGSSGAEKLEQLLQHARPALQPRQHLEGWPHGQEVSFVAIHSTPGETTSGQQKLAEILLQQQLPVSVVPFLSRERLVFLRMAGGFPLRALELRALHSAYLAELGGSKIAPHSRTNVRWRALSRPSERERERIGETLATAVRLGNLEPGDTLECPRCADMASVTSCLYLFHDPLEGLVTQATLLESLAAWEAEKLDEIGVESYLEQLEQESESHTLLGEELAPALHRAAQQLRAQLEERWREWDPVLADCLKHAPSLSQGDLVTIPAGFRRWAMHRYELSHAGEGMLFNAGTGRLEQVSLRDPAQLETGLSRLEEGETLESEVFARAAGEIIAFFCQALGFSPGRPVGQGALWGRTIGIRDLRVRIPESVPFLAFQKDVLGPEDLSDLLHLVGDHRLVFLLVRDDMEAHRARLPAGPQHFVLLCPDDLRSILRDKSRLSGLMRRVLNQIELPVVSPFVVEGPVSEAMLFGRDTEIKEIVQRLEHRSVALVGGRRVGKTSVIERVIAALSKQARPVFYLDCASLNKGADLLMGLATQHLPDWEPKMNLSAILMEMQHRHEGRQAVIVLENLDPMLGHDFSNLEFLGRAFRQATGDGKCVLLLSGERTLNQRLSQSDSTFFELCHSLHLKYLSLEDATDLITRPLEQMEIRFEDRQAALEMLLYVSSGHPNVIQRACRALIGRLSQEHTRLVETELLRDMLTDPTFAEEYLETMWGWSGKWERIASLALQMEEELTPQELRQRLSEEYGLTPDLKELAESLANLHLYGLLERIGPRYALAVRSFPEMAGQVMEPMEWIERFRKAT